MKILVITNTIPYPTTSGGAVRNYNLLRRIASHHQVWLGSTLESVDELMGIPQLLEFCQGVVTGLIKRKGKTNHFPGLLRYATKGWPLELKFRECQELNGKIRKLCHEIDFDIIQIEESRMALYLEQLPVENLSKRILTFYDIGFSQTKRFTALERDWLMKMRSALFYWEMRRWEPRYAKKFDKLITVSEVDKSLLLKANPRLKVDVIPNGVDTSLLHLLPVNKTKPKILFIGNMSYLPCIDGALYLVNEIVPYLRNKLPEFETWIVGADPVDEVKKLAGDAVFITGKVPDILPYYAQCSVCVVPIRAGGGTRLKILEAMALGRPVVSTTIGSEGLNVQNEQHLLISDQTEEFASQIVRLLMDDNLYQKLVINSRRLVVEKFDWDKIAADLLGVYDELVK
jgi:polysaccharide biosynthesis protein PslH